MSGRAHPFLRSRAILPLVGAALLLPGGAAAHHGAAAHFDLNQKIDISGTVVRFERINPHSFLYVSVSGTSGASDVWQCELNGTSQLTRLGINKDTFRPGDKIEIEANPGRRDAHACLFISARLASGQTITARLDLGPPPPVTQLDTTIVGTWMPQFGPPPGESAPLARSAPPPPFNPLNFTTDAGRLASQRYDPIRDDPVRKCSPVNPIRLWAEPSYPLEIRKVNDGFALHYEFMDAERTVHLTTSEHAEKARRTLLGYSIGHMEGNALVVETTAFTPGVIMQYGQDSDGKTAGVLHSDAYHVAEKVAVNAQTNRLEVTVVQQDPKYFTKPFPPRTFTYARRPDLKLDKFNCVPDKDLNH